MRLEDFVGCLSYLTLNASQKALQLASEGTMFELHLARPGDQVLIFFWGPVLLVAVGVFIWLNNPTRTSQFEREQAEMKAESERNQARLASIRARETADRKAREEQLQRQAETAKRAEEQRALLAMEEWRRKSEAEQRQQAQKEAEHLRKRERVLEELHSAMRKDLE